MKLTPAQRADFDQRLATFNGHLDNIVVDYRRRLAAGTPGDELAISLTLSLPQDAEILASLVTAAVRRLATQ